MSPDERTRTGEGAESVAAATLLDVIGGMIRELRPGTPARAVRLDDRIDRDLGLDSLSRVELTLRIERAFGARLPEHVAIAARTPRDLLAAIARAERAPDAAAPPPAPVAPAPPVAGTPAAASTIVEAFRWHLERHPEREHIRLIDGERTLGVLSYAQLWTAAAETAGGLRAAGIGRGDAVALMLPTGREFFEAFLGAMIAGAIPVPLYPPTRWSEIGDHVRGRAAILANAGARMLVTVPEAMFVAQIARAMLPDLRAVVTVDALRRGGGPADPAAASGGDTALLQYTSGSTGDPKGVVLSHDNLLANIRAMGVAAAATSDDRFVSWLPLYHDMGLIGAWLGTLYYAIPLAVMPPTSFLARPASWLRAIDRYRATISAGPNFAYEIVSSKVLDEDLAGLDLRTWRLAFNGAEPVRAATLERFAARFARYGFDRRALTPVYGLAESAVGLAFPPLGRGPLVERVDPRALDEDGVARPAPAAAALHVVSCGRPLPGHEIRVVDQGGREVAERVEGRVEFRGASATRGYYRNPDATQRLFRGDWLDTGDVGYIAGGELFLTSRAKDLIKRGGHNIHPYDMEATVGDVPGIRKGCVAVFGTADQASGTERVIVVAETGASAPEAREALRARITALATVHLDGPPDDVLLVPPHTILKTSSGKIRRAACRDLYERGMLTAPRPAAWLQIAGLIRRASGAKLRRALRALAGTLYGVYAWTLVVALAAVGVPLLAIVGNARARRRLAHLGARALLGACGIRLDVGGLDNLPSDRPAVIVVNHASYVDALVVLAALPGDFRFAAKREFARAPLFAFVLRRVGTYFVDRVDPAGGVEDTRQIADAVAEGRSVVFFPEGTFSRAPGLAAFRLGAFSVSVATGAPIVPVVLRGTRSVLREGRWLPTRGPVAVGVRPAVLPVGRDWSAVVRLRDDVREAMLQHCGEPDLCPPGPAPAAPAATTGDDRGR